jgi:diguanylate cyclase (GGDEF)-like protein/PAS domain S-box-containing protein
VSNLLASLALVSLLLVMSSSHSLPTRLSLTALEAVVNAVVITELDGTIRWVNPAFTRLTGYAPAEAIGRNPRLLKSGAHDASFYQELWRTILSGSVWSGEIINRRKDGSTYVEEQTITPVRDTRGAISHFIAIKQDITSRRRLQNDLQDSELRFRRLFETARDGILLLEADTGEITEANPSLVEMLGYPRAEILGKKLWEIGAFANVDACRAIFQELQARGYIRYDNLALQSKTGQPINVEFVSSTYQVDGHKVIQCNIRDISVRIMAEEGLRATYEKLAGWVNELEQRHREMAVLNDMGDLLHACVTVENVYAVIRQFAPQILPTEEGLLGILNAPRNLIQPTVTWGGSATSLSEHSFPADKCWALRHGRLHWVEATPTGLLCELCAHLSLPAPSASVCVPLSAQNETIGLLHVSMPHSEPGRLLESKRQLAETLARHIELALANLRLRETLRAQSIRDPLTGLFNRRYMEESLALEVARAARSGEPLSIIMLDVDHFKAVNDTFGHEAGDVLLRELGQLVQTRIRAGDIACRYGGEEFTLIVPNAALETAVQRAEQLRKLATQLTTEYQGRLLGPITVSFGIAAFPAHGSSQEALLRAADAALYRAKAEGRDRVIVAQ